MIKKIFSFISILTFIALISSCNFFVTTDDDKKDNHYSGRDDYFVVTLVNNSSSDIINWYLLDIRTNTKYGDKNDIVVERGDSKSYSFKGFKSYEPTIVFDEKNTYISKDVYLENNIKIIITGNRYDPEFQIIVDNSRKNIELHNVASQIN